MNYYRRLAGAALFMCGTAFFGCGGDDGGGTEGTSGAGGGDASKDVSSEADTGAGGETSVKGDGEAGIDAATCRLVGATCAGNADCCTASCDAQAKICTAALGACQAPGSACTIPQDCCTLVCAGGVCGANLCTSDNKPCSSGAECCGGVCGGGQDGGTEGGATNVCVPLNNGCRTSGNECGTNDECCSKVCRNGICAGSVSFCTQNRDACSSDFECCGGLCTKANGATLGVCSEPSAPGATGCTVAGQVCGASATADGGVAADDAGVPTCGGDCCSRSCLPYKPGVTICEPPSGCRPTGEICRSDIDCCGGIGSAEPTGVSCSKANANDPVGRCDNGNACRPAGAICKLATMSCNAENNCCAGNVNQNPFVCQQDTLGIPRCTLVGEECNPDAGSRAGAKCATSADCCGLACVPNPSFDADAGPDAGAAPFVCGGLCVAQGGSCTTAADCCPGLPCTASPGASIGTCGAPPTGDAGVTDSGTPPGDAMTPPDATTPPGDGGVCAAYGQICTTSSDCCLGLPCPNGRCVIVR